MRGSQLQWALVAFLVMVPGVIRAQPGGLSAVVEEAWSAVDSMYYDAAFHGLDWDALRHTYVQRDYADANAAYDAIREMLARLGNPATRFLTPSQTTALLADFAGGPQDGIGLLELLSVDTDEATGDIVIVTPVPGGPAARAGLRPGDVIVSLDGASTSNLDLAAVAERLRGIPGTDVRLRIRRKDRIIELQIPRERVDAVDPVEGFAREVEGHRLGYVGIRQFTPETVVQLDDLLDGLDADGYILDLRNNPGGFVPVLEHVASIFLGEAKLAHLHGRSPEPTVLSSSGEQRVQSPLAVLVNEGSASAAEALASALEHHGRAAIVGTRTFGKGLAHGFAQLSDGSAVMPTIGRLATLNGRDILTAGIEPTTIVPMNTSPVIDTSIEAASEQDLQFAQAATHLTKLLVD